MTPFRILALAFALAFSAHAHGAEITGAGATFPNPLYQKWAAEYRSPNNDHVTYQPVGSALGIKAIEQGTVTFGASDMPLKSEDLKKSSLIQFPTVIGGVTPVVNLRGVKAGQMILDGPTLSLIYLGEVTRWDDPAIQNLNPGLALPGQPIAVLYRSDGSGTTFIFTDYLSKQSSAWKQDIGAAAAVDWPVGAGARGNEGVSSNVAQISGAIGYVEFAYAVEHDLSYTKLVNRSGKTVSPSIESFQAAAANADWSAPDFYLVLTDEPGDGIWPISGATFVLMRKKPRDPAAAAAALKFFGWAFDKGDATALKLNYVPIPDSAVNLVKASWAANSLVP